jgi:uncharacterized metal-binding protein YceD (DUF177 family)
LIVDVARLDKGGEWYRGETAPEVSDFGTEISTPLGGILYALFIQALGTELLVRGEVRQKLTCLCSRCGESFETEVEDKEFVCSLEINGETDFLDLTGDIREAIILALPGYPVCRETCKGLCPTCGANLNKKKCRCRSTGSDGRWAALESLK